jgi:hypothetical protein
MAQRPDSRVTAENHFRLHFYRVVATLLARMAGDAQLAPLLERFPFLDGYAAALRDYYSQEVAESATPGAVDGWWREQIGAYEAQAHEHLPLRALATDAGLGDDEIHVLILSGLVDEDVRFGTLYANLQEPVQARRPCVGLLTWLLGWEMGEVWSVCRRLLDAGLLTVDNQGDTRSEWLLRCPAPVWDAVRGLVQEQPHPHLRRQPAHSFPALADLILPETLQAQVARIPPLLLDGQIGTLVLRGMKGSGRRTTLGAVAAALGRDILLGESTAAGGLDEEGRRLLGPLALLSGAMPVLRCDPPPGEALEQPALPGYRGAVGVTIGRHGGLKGALVEHALTLLLPPPDAGARRHFWQRSGAAIAEAHLPRLTHEFLLTGGAIQRVAGLGMSYAALEGRQALTAQDARQALQTLNRQALETLATALDPIGDWSEVVVGESLLDDLRALEARCRGREQLQVEAGRAFRHSLNRGVRVLFGGPSGTGKTLAARALAGTLELDIYRVDLAAVVNKYIGETERNLNQVFSRAEELNVVLLLDEGDALMARRTDVSNANDRYANLETNYLLQRLETYEGIVVITTNAAQRIDTAFLRRLDMVVEFAPPDVAERWRIWQAHLPQEHAVSEGMLREVATRCALTGGQIRNAALHATLLAMEEGGVVGDAEVDAALQREYRKAGAAFPLRARVNGQGQMAELQRLAAQLR